MTTKMVLIVAAFMVMLGLAGTAFTQVDRVTICHRGQRTLVVPAAAVAAHLAHGDFFGPCPS